MVHVQLTLKSPDGASPQWLTVQPTTVSLRPGWKRKILVSSSSAGDVPTCQYGAIQIDATPEQGDAIGKIDVPVCLLARTEEVPGLEIGSIAWDGQSTQPGFVLGVTNTGAMHASLHGTLSLTGALGRTVELQAGFGQWLLPGQSTQLKFRTKFAPPPADYQFKLDLKSADEPQETLTGTVRVE